MREAPIRFGEALVVLGQARQFSTPHTGGVERHQYDAMKGSLC